MSSVNDMRPGAFPSSNWYSTRVKNGIDFDSEILPGRFRTTVLTDLYDATKDIKQAQAAAGHTTAAMTLKHYVKGRQERSNTALPIAAAYGLTPDGKTDFGKL